VAPVHFPGAGKNVLFYACMRLRAPRSGKLAELSSEGEFEGIENDGRSAVLRKPQAARRGMLSQNLFESQNDPPSRRSSAVNGHGNGREVITPPPGALVHEKWVADLEGDKNAPLKNLPYHFPDFGPRDSGEQEQIPFPPSPAVPEESAGGHDKENEEVEVEGDVVVEVDDEGKEEKKEEEIKSRSSEEAPSFSGRASNLLWSLGQHPSRYLSVTLPSPSPWAVKSFTDSRDPTLGPSFCQELLMTNPHVLQGTLTVPY
jgi:hypothetical protein